MKLLQLFLFILICHSSFSQDLSHEYVQKWKSFYPANALQMGMHETSFQFQDVSDSTIKEWLDYNRMLLQKLEENGNSEMPSANINNKLLKTQIRKEIHKWSQQKPHETSLSFYTEILKRAFNRYKGMDMLTPDEIDYLQCKSYKSISDLCSELLHSLSVIYDNDLERSKRELHSIMKTLVKEKNNFQATEPSDLPCANIVKITDLAIGKIEEVLSHIVTIPHEPGSPTLGNEEYARQLALYTDSDLQPEELEAMALEEIRETKKIMARVSEDYLVNIYPDMELPQDKSSMIRLALTDMEKDVVKSANEYLDFWLELEEAATSFVRDKDIATLPEHPTLRIKTAPESAGAAARIGWVASAPPFHPNPLTTLYLPSIPDTLPEQEQIDFWSSFNKPFNRMIVIHELIPGHYMQLKISRETPHKLRLLFPYGPYIEGWATFCEKIVLDAGWDKKRPLTYLAHLRKRLENANRAYTSVMVHCYGWDEDQVMKFSTETSLLAPQFAKSLWGRLLRSPMQITSYYYGGALFKELYKHEKERLRERFNLKFFMDTIMKAGPIPIDEFYNIFAGHQ